MSNYIPIVSYGPKDSLAHGDANKAIKGAQLDAELSAISAAISTKLDASAVTASAVPFVATMSGTNGASGSASLLYMKLGPVVQVFSTADYLGSSGAGAGGLSMIFTALPPAIRPSSTLTLPAISYLFTNGNYSASSVATLANSGVLSIFQGSLPANWQWGVGKSSIFITYYLQ